MGLFYGLYSLCLGIKRELFCGPLNTTSSIKIQLFMVQLLCDVYLVWWCMEGTYRFNYDFEISSKIWRVLTLKWENSLIWIAWWFVVLLRLWTVYDNVFYYLLPYLRSHLFLSSKFISQLKISFCKLNIGEFRVCVVPGDNWNLKALCEEHSLTMQLITETGSCLESTTSDIFPLSTFLRRMPHSIF